jgi:hypothetical protein
MNPRVLFIPLAICALGAGATPTLKIMWHLDCPVVAHWCAPLNSDLCRQVRPSDDYDFFVTNLDNKSHTATVKLTTIPAAFVLPATLPPSPQSTPSPQPPTPQTMQANFTETAVTWTAPPGSITANFVLWRASQRLIVTTMSMTQIDWEGTCARVNNKLLTATPKPSATPHKTAATANPSNEALRRLAYVVLTVRSIR